MAIEYIPAKTIVSNYKVNDHWFGCEYTMNLYKGCSHGCIYCDSRSDCYHIEHFDQIRAKENAIAIVDSELRKKRRKGIIGTGSMSDPYNPLEKELKLTREALKRISAHGYGVAIFTKSDLITRDIDVLKSINEISPVICCITITSADDDLCKLIEPHVCSASARFRAVRELSEAGIFTGVLLTPVLPYITDTVENIKKITHLAHENGAEFIYSMFGVTLRSNQREYYYEKLDRHFPSLKKKYMFSYGDQYSCSCKGSRELWRTFSADCESFGLCYKMEDIIAGYKGKREHVQLSLF